jgi:hypothetical protein
MSKFSRWDGYRRNKRGKKFRNGKMPAAVSRQKAKLEISIWLPSSDESEQRNQGRAEE